MYNDFWNPWVLTQAYFNATSLMYVFKWVLHNNHKSWLKMYTMYLIYDFNAY